MEKDNRKSHLVPQASSSNRQLLRPDEPQNISHSSNPPSRSSLTPISGNIPSGDAGIDSSISCHKNDETMSRRTQLREINSHDVSRTGDNLAIRTAATSSSSHVAPLAVSERNICLSSGTKGVNLASTKLAMRPAPTGPLPPPPVPKKEGSEFESKSLGKKQATIGNYLYGSTYSSNGNRA